MRFESIDIHNLGPFADVRLDLSRAAGRQLIAITGDNGAGKSTLLELFAGGLYRQCPTRGSLLKLATARDARVEVHAVNSSPFTIRQLADPVSKRSETLIVRDGKPVLEGTNVRAADAWIAHHLPRPEVLYASAFLAQGSHGFVELSPAERKSVLVRLLQIERYEAMAEAARDHARHAKAALGTARARFEDACSQHPDLQQAQTLLAAAKKQLEVTEQNVLAQRAKLAQAQNQLDEQTSAWAHASRRTVLNDKRADFAREEFDLRERIRNNEKILARKDAITQAADRLLTLRVEHETAHHSASVAALTLGKAATQLTALTRSEQTALRALATAEERHESYSADIEDQSAVEKAVKALPRVREAHTAASAAATAAATALEHAKEAASGAKGKRITALRTGLETIADGRTVKQSVKPNATRIAKDTLKADDELAAATNPAHIKQLTAASDEAAAALTKAEAVLRRAEQTAARAKDLRAAQARLQGALNDLEQARSAAKAATAEREAAHESHRKAKETHARAVATRETLEVDIAVLEEDAALLPKLEQADVRLQEVLRPRLAAVMAGRAEIQTELDALPPEPKQSLEHYQGYRDAVERSLRSTEQTHTQAHTEVALAVRRLEDAQRGADIRRARQAECTQCETTLADWTRLSQDLGKDGLQALEIDAALPQLNTLINDLLHNCHGPRFTVELRTASLSSDGNKSLEDLDVRVIDAERGRDASIETYSGGESVLIAEAVSLALTMLACQRAGLAHPTLVRDESGASLDPGNARAYIAMLRRAADMLQADKVLFVTHSPELQDMADAHIRVCAGTAQLVLA